MRKLFNFEFTIFTTMNAYVYNGKEIVPSNHQGISFNNRGLIYGETFFTTLRTYQGKPLFLKDHLCRLRQNLDYFFPDVRLNFDTYIKQITEGINELTKKLVNAQNDLSLRITFYPENYFPFDLTSQPDKINYFILANPISPKLFQEQRLKIETVNRTECKCHQKVFIKTSSYMETARILRYVRARGMDDVIFINHEGYLSEGATSNLFFKKDAIVYTPSLQSGILEGITRNHLIQCLRQNNIVIKEGSYSKKDLLDADLVWLSSSVKGLRPIHSIDDLTFDKNPFFEHITQLFKTYCTSL